LGYGLVFAGLALITQLKGGPTLCHLVDDHEYAREHHRESTIDEGTVYEISMSWRWCLKMAMVIAA
jgi:hypothetical protein